MYSSKPQSHFAIVEIKPQSHFAIVEIKPHGVIPQTEQMLIILKIQVAEGGKRRKFSGTLAPVAPPHGVVPNKIHVHPEVSFKNKNEKCVFIIFWLT